MFHKHIMYIFYCKNISNTFDRRKNVAYYMKYIWYIIILLLICIAKNLIGTTLKSIFSIFRFFVWTLKLQIFKYM